MNTSDFLEELHEKQRSKKSRKKFLIKFIITSIVYFTSITLSVINGGFHLGHLMLFILIYVLFTGAIFERTDQ